ncbi:UNVERIFIED_CONTAM: Mitochondrial outer membrane protein porin 6 [Sesamum radiatum]|uniref:Mitochondrial outer membrane protein porin 6 n=1 Tax=Sesamum radiatum TaxID=300843 RepID=A0AAW2LC53_SESRA
MANGPASFSEIGRRARDLLTKDYNYDQKFSLSIPSSTGMGLTATGIKKDQIFVGDISTQYRSGKATVDVKVDTYSNISTKVTYDVVPGTKAAISFNVPDHKSGKTLDDSELHIFLYALYGQEQVKDKNDTAYPSASISLDVHYIHHHAAINSSIGLNPSPLLEVAAAIGSKDVAIGGEIGFDTSSSSFTKCNAGISFNMPDFSAALILYVTVYLSSMPFMIVLLSLITFGGPACGLLRHKGYNLIWFMTVVVHFELQKLMADKGQTVKASFAHLVNPLTGTEVAAEMTHRLSGYENSFSIGSVHKVDPLTLVKTRFSDNGKVAVLSQRQWA